MLYCGIPAQQSASHWEGKQLTPGKVDIQVTVILGGGRDKRGELTDLSRQRLDKGAALYRDNVAKKLLVMGGHYSAWSPKAIKFPQPTAELSKAYLTAKGVTDADIIVAPEEARDTIGEAFLTRKVLRNAGLTRILLVTSDKHMKRALFIFQRILGNDMRIDTAEVPCGSLLHEAEEQQYLGAAVQLFASLPAVIPDPPNWDAWYAHYGWLYEEYDRIRAQFATGHDPSQAYGAIHDE